MPELRQNIITGDWVVVAPERARRPRDFVIPKSIKVSDKSRCPFCVGGEGYKANKDAIRSHSPHTYVMENRFPAFIENEANRSVRCFYPEDGFYRARASLGDHEIVVIEDHDHNIFEISKMVMNELFEVFRERYLWIKENDEGIATIMPIYNHGAEAGASIDHPHAQIFASGIIANTIGRELTGSEEYYGINGACVYCDLVKHELKEKVRIVYKNDSFVAFNFYASRFPFETWILPIKHESQFELVTKEKMKDFSDAVWNVLSMIDKTLDNPPLNFYIHTLPTIEESSDSFHWHLEIVPRVSRYGGFEIGSEVIINTMPPEEAASYLKGGKTDK